MLSASRNLEGTAKGCGSIPRQVLLDLGDREVAMSLVDDEMEKLFEKPT